MKTDIEIAQAAEMLPIAQIARQVGYPNSSNLIVQFTDRVGCSPQQFRAEHQGKE